MADETPHFTCVFCLPVNNKSDTMFYRSYSSGVDSEHSLTMPQRAGLVMTLGMNLVV